jgi:lambda repressor-like predicted transcriptional regulator
MNGQMRLKVGLRVRGMTVEELSLLTGIEVNRIRALLSSRYPNDDELELIAQALCVDMDYFLRDDSD